VNSDLFGQLLNEEESTVLDFKRAQYPFEAATNEQKGELLKDILAFANSWRRTDGYIIISVSEVKGVTFPPKKHCQNKIEKNGH
jgi:hypothetical protein